MDLFAKRLKELRNEFDLTQKELAERTGVTNVSISRYEGKKRIDPPRSELVKLSGFFNVSLDYLLGLTDIRESTSIDDIEKYFLTLSEENKLKAISYLKFLIAEQSK